MIPFSSFILTMFHNVKNPFIRYLSGFFPDLLYLDKIKQIDHAWSLFTSRINRDTVILNNRICLSYLRKRHMWELLEGEDRFLPRSPLKLSAPYPSGCDRGYTHSVTDKQYHVLSNVGVGLEIQSLPQLFLCHLIPNVGSYKKMYG